MPAVLTALSVVECDPGTELVLTGTSFIAGAVVAFAATVGTLSATATPLSIAATSIRVVVPDVLLGDEGTVQVTVTNPSQAASNALVLDLNAWPPVEAVYPLCSLRQLKESLAIEDADKYSDTRLRRAIRAASAAIAGWCGRDFKPTTHTGVLYDGDGTQVLYLRDTPVTSVSAVTIDGAAVSLAELKVYEDRIAFELDTEFSAEAYSIRLRGEGRVFPAGRQNVAVTSVAGYVKVPADLSEGAVAQAIYLLNTLPKAGVLNEGQVQVGVQTAWSQAELCAAARRLCNVYRKGKAAVQAV
jgi:hypothetical protein